jgi:3-hydroxyacyl-[acyl-carrier-protein] dehydratase
MIPYLTGLCHGVNEVNERGIHYQYVEKKEEKASLSTQIMEGFFSMIDVQNVLPHRYPFLMVDRVTEVIQGSLATGFKNVTWNEWFISEQQPTMPGTLVLEALAQLGAFAAAGTVSGLGFLSSFKNAEFRKLPRPGDQVQLRYEITRSKRGFVMGKGTALVDGEVYVSAEEIMVYYQGDAQG